MSLASTILRWLAACSLLLGCQAKSPAPLAIGQLQVEAVDLPRRDLPSDSALRRALERAGGLAWARPQPASAAHGPLPRIGVAVARRSARAGAATPHVPYMVRLRLTEPDAPSLVASGTRTRHLEASEPLADVAGDNEALVVEAVQAAWSRVRGKRDLIEAGPDQWLATFAERPSPAHAAREPWAAVVAYERLALAIDCLAARRHRGALEPLLSVVRDGQAEVTTTLDAALGRKAIRALAALGNEQAVLPLIDAAQHQPSDQVVQVAYAVGAIGGRTATGWLWTLATGHEDDDVRQAARAALGELP